MLVTLFRPILFICRMLTIPTMPAMYCLLFACLSIYLYSSNNKQFAIQLNIQ